MSNKSMPAKNVQRGALTHSEIKDRRSDQLKALSAKHW